MRCDEVRDRSFPIDAVAILAALRREERPSAADRRAEESLLACAERGREQFPAGARAKTARWKFAEQSLQDATWWRKTVDVLLTHRPFCSCRPFQSGLR